jgi:hypothetical protein
MPALNWSAASRLPALVFCAHHIRGRRIGGIVHRPHRNRRRVLARVIHHLADEGRHAVDGETRPALGGALLFVFGPPLPRQAREFQIVQRLVAIVGLALLALFEQLAGFFQDVVVLGHQSFQMRMCGGADAAQEFSRETEMKKAPVGAC